MFMSNSLTSSFSDKSTGFLSDAFSWAKKNISVSNIDKLGQNISNIGSTVTNAINSGKKALSDVASDVGAAAGKGFFDQNKWWIIGGAGAIALLFFFTMRKK